MACLAAAEVSGGAAGAAGRQASSAARSRMTRETGRIVGLRMGRATTIRALPRGRKRAIFANRSLFARPVLRVADLLHPVGALAVELFHNGDVRHGRGRRGAVPVLLIRRDPDHVTRPDFLDRATPALHPAAASRHDQGLTQRVGVPCCPSAGLECDTGAERACWTVCLEQGIDAYSAGKILGRSSARWL